jgi:hypothetical protein
MSPTLTDCCRRDPVILANYVRFAKKTWPWLNWAKLTANDAIGVSLPACRQLCSGIDRLPLKAN